MKRTYLFLVFILVNLILLNGCSHTETSFKPVDIDYTVVEKNDDYIGRAKRLIWQVVINEPATIDQIKNLSKALTAEAKKDTKFNALAIFYYDYFEYIGYGYTLGKATYAPEGKWGKAMDVNTGQYNKMKFKWEMRKKDWDKQLTQKEVDIWKAWKIEIEKAWKKIDPNSLDSPSEEEAINIIADRYNLSFEEVDKILFKQINWTFMDNKQE